MGIKNNTTSLQSILNKVNSLPSANNGVELPELSNHARPEELLQNKELIDQDGNIVTGIMPNNGTISSTMDGIDVKSVTIPEGYTSGGIVSLDDTIDNEVDTQADLIAQIKNTVNALPEAGSGGIDTSDATATVSTILSGYTAYVDGEKITGNIQSQAAKTIVPSTTSQIAVSSGFYTTGNITVDAIPSNYIVPSGTLTITTNGTVDVKNYASATVNVASSGGSGGNTGFEKSMITRTLTEYTNNEIAKIGQYAFATCTNLSVANLPNCSLIDNYAFNGCTSLENISFPKCSMLNYYAFNNCTNLTSAEFSVCNYIHNGVFSNCSKLTTLVLNYSSVATLNNVGAFKNSPMSVSTYTGTFGSIYVPASLVDAYKSATNWTTYADRITAIIE